MKHFRARVFWADLKQELLRTEAGNRYSLPSSFCQKTTGSRTMKFSWRVFWPLNVLANERSFVAVFLDRVVAGRYVVTVGGGAGTNLDFGNYIVATPIYGGSITNWNMNLGWPTSAMKWQLQWTTNLARPWTLVANPNLVICNAWNSVTIPIATTNKRFFRRVTQPQLNLFRAG